MSILKRFAKARSGSVAVIYGLAIIPLFGFLGIAVDYTRASAARTTLQTAVDATVLHLARAATAKSEGELATLGAQLLPAEIGAHENLPLSGVEVIKSEKQVSLTAKSTVATTFSNLFGIKAMEIAAAGAATFGKKVEIALVLDNTGSMGGSVSGVQKMAQLKTSTLKLLADLKAAAFEADQVRVSIVPFDTQVNLGTSFKDETWLDFNPTLPAKHWNEKTSKAAWKGCVIDREQPNDANAVNPSNAVKGLMHPAVACETGKLAKVTPLQDVLSSTGYDTLKKAIDAMSPSGCTNITMGAHWGRETLSKSAPFTEASTEPGVLRFMILLTDGDNTQNRFVNACGAGGAATSIDSRTLDMCSTIKGESVALYTIGFTGGNETMLAKCATSPGMYANVKSPTALDAVFSAIVKEILRIRLTS